ncbi:MAG: hypothetical protein DHS20C18_14620 [Saprospiraceae bacterium]|nr:MAG: hypothetical protein DHS20C18_14620 [Saprospiraceae bacterium]
MFFRLIFCTSGSNKENLSLQELNLHPMRIDYKLMLFLSLVVYLPVQAQISAGGQPPSFNAKNRTVFKQSIPIRSLTAPDLTKLKTEDEQGPALRFAAPIPTDIRPDKDGQWTVLENGNRVWRIRIQVKGALALAALYEDFHLPVGGRLFMYNPDKSQLLGAYTHKNNQESGHFMTGLIEGDGFILEYFEPAAVKGQGHFRIFRVDYAYHRENYAAGKSLLNDFGFGASLDCHLNANCNQGDDWRDQQRGVCRIIVVVQEGMGYCTGSLINNTANDGTPYLLSAYHCQDGYTPLWDLYRFDFNYQSEDCDNPAEEPVFNSILGSTYRAGRQQSDFILLELNGEIPGNYNVYLNGWNRRSETPTQSAMFHHPVGDIKKFSNSTQTATIQGTSINWNNGVTTPANHHFRVNFTNGTFEVGSSGCALFDEDGWIVGQLNGGTNVCDGLTFGYFGRFSNSWTGGNTAATSLVDWLDPLGLGVDTLNGTNLGNDAIEGTILNESGEAIVNVVIQLDGPEGLQYDTTGVDGLYRFEDLTSGATYSIQPMKDYNYGNGVSTVDLIHIQKQILSVAALDSPYKLLSADVNLSGNISTLDAIKIKKVILGTATSFDGATSWQFIPEDYIFIDSENPFNENIPQETTIATLNGLHSVNFVGFKSGDVNVSADPGN